MNKEQLRQQFLEKRKNLNLYLLQEQSRAISRIFFDYFDVNAIHNLHIFLSIRKHNEIDTGLLIEKIRRNYPHISLIVPKSNLRTAEMESYLLTADTAVNENRWGIPEPVAAKPFPEMMLDTIVLPLLCFDRRGFRVGYGKGFYDRFLQKCPKDIVKIGLSLFAPVAEITDINVHDVKMDFCITPAKVYNFQKPIKF